MGFNLNKARAAKEEILKSFFPIDLNEGNVQAIFNGCLATENTPEDDEQLSILFQKDFGYEKDSAPIVFSKSRIIQNKQNILYLLGQLKSVHEHNLRITSTESVYKYNGEKWTTDTATIMKLYHLSEAAKGIGPFVKKYNSANTRSGVKPTLSPKDPAFPAWWEAHKGEWEQ